MKLLHIIAIGLSAALFCSFAPVQEDGVYVKPRVIVTCDPELDDNNSMVRYLLHSNDFQTEGLIYTSSRFHWRGDGTGKTQFKKGSEYDQMGLGPQTSWRYKWDERFIDDIVDAYTKCYQNLKVHDLSYPTPEYLKSIVKVGNVDFEGDISKDTPGSELIKRVFLDDKPGKVYAQAWGGGASVGRALKSIEDQYKGTDQWNAIYKKICDKVVLCFSGDQDEVYQDYIGVVWKDIPFLCARSSDRYDNSKYNFYREPEWTAANLRIGPMGERVRCWGDGKQMCPYDLTDYMGLSGYTREDLEKMGYRVWIDPQPKGTLYSDGDSGCYFNLIDNGLRAWVDDTWGGWSGRRDPSVPIDNYRPRPLRANLTPMSQAKRDSMMKAMAAMMQGGQPGQQPKENILPNFYHERMDQEAARMKWSVTPNYADANHFPIVAGPFELTAKPGEKVKINAKAVDPDGDKLTIKWMQFKVGTYPGTIAIADPSAVQVEFTVPKDAKPGQTIHMVMQATDDGEYNLVKYLRTVITVK